MPQQAEDNRALEKYKHADDTKVKELTLALEKVSKQVGRGRPGGHLGRETPGPGAALVTECRLLPSCPEGGFLLIAVVIAFGGLLCGRLHARHMLIATCITLVHPWPAGCGQEGRAGAGGGGDTGGADPAGQGGGGLSEAARGAAGMGVRREATQPLC